jgi:sulfur-carrier protein adenylyltransferase/sulfurtransferase
MFNNMGEYYSSHQKLSFINVPGQNQLQQAKVLVIGAGGLGCPCLQMLTGAGIGIIGIADYDTVAISNLHRQYLYNYNDAGKLKIRVAAERLTQYNPFIKIQTHQLLVDESNILDLLSQYDLIIDGTDNFTTRYLINDACIFINKPLVYGAIHQAEGHVTVFNYKGSPTLRCLFPKDENESIASCAEIGAYNVATGIIGLMMANEAIKILLQHPDVLAGKLNQVDILTGRTLQVQYKEANDSRQKSIDRFTTSHRNNTISPEALKERLGNNQPVYLIDVREAAEYHEWNIGGINIPLQAFLNQTSFDFSTTDDIVLYCQKGIRSKQAVDYLSSIGFQNALSLQGGIDLWQKISADI